MSALEFQAQLYERLAVDSGFGKELTKLMNNLNNSDIKIAKKELAHFQDNVFYPFLEKHTNKGQKPYSPDRGRVIPKFINPIAVIRRKKGEIRADYQNRFIRCLTFLTTKKIGKILLREKVKVFHGSNLIKPIKIVFQSSSYR